MNNDKGKTLSLTNSQAAEEVKIVVENIHRHHPDPFHVSSKSEFYSKVEDLLDRKGEILIAEQYFALSQISSLIFDTHTQVHITENTPGFNVSFPLRFKIFPDGLFIIAGNENYHDLIGKKVISISGQGPEEVINKLSQYAASDNVRRKRVFAESFLYMPETYVFFDLKTAEDKIELGLQSLNGQHSTFELSSTWEKGYSDFSWERLNPFLPKEFQTVHDILGTKPPFYLQHLDDNYHFHFLDDEKKVMYIQINLQFDKADQHSIEFHLEWTKALWEAKSEIVIVDLRNDPGGMTNVGSGIPKFLENVFFTQSTLQGIAILFGTDSVSAGTILIAELENAVWPIMIGEPTGSSPNMYLNAHNIELPYSKLKFEVSKDIYISVYPADPRAYIAPDIPMALSFEDYANGRDPLIEISKTITREKMEKTYAGASHTAPWMRESQAKAIRNKLL